MCISALVSPILIVSMIAHLSISSHPQDRCPSYLSGVTPFCSGSNNWNVHFVSSSSLGLYGVLVPGLPIVVHKSSMRLSGPHRCDLSFVRGDYLWTAHPHRVVRVWICSIRIRQNNQGKDRSGWREIQETLSLTVRSQGAKQRRPVTFFVSRRAGSSHSEFPCGPPTASTTAAALCLPIQPARGTTSAASRCRMHRSLYRSSQRTGANPSPLGECHIKRLPASSHHGVPEFVFARDVCPITVPKLHLCLWKRTDVTVIVLVAYLALQTCFRCTIASTYKLALGQSMMEAAREVYCLKVRRAPWPIDHYRVWALNCSSSVPHRTSRWAHPADPFTILSPFHIHKDL